jgi:DNA-directed RNA polymerase specialized sigma24 family protein
MLLGEIRAGREGAADDLVALVYDDLRAMARQRMAHVPPGDTLQPTAVVNEAYLRLFGKDHTEWQSRRHARLKHGGGRKRLELDEEAVAMDSQPNDLLALDEALRELESRDDRIAEVVVMRYFTGLTVAQTAEATDLSPATVDRYWRFARAWLRARIRGDEARGAWIEHDGR